ncbi:MAG: hypothetical protein KC535_01970 [Nanoarchaeota archaeon]|nr:hypothetical protein [Nanoarchaeota archaeon]
MGVQDTEQLHTIMVHGNYLGPPTFFSLDNNVSYPLEKGDILFFQTFRPFYYLTHLSTQEQQDYLSEFINYDFSEGVQKYLKIVHVPPSFTYEGVKKFLYPTDSLSKLLKEYSLMIENLNHALDVRVSWDGFQGKDQFIPLQKRFQNSLKVIDSFSSSNLDESIEAFMSSQFDHLAHDEFSEFNFFNKVLKEKKGWNDILTEINYHLLTKRNSIREVADDFLDLYTRKFKAVVYEDKAIEQAYSHAIKGFFHEHRELFKK